MRPIVPLLTASLLASAGGALGTQPPSGIARLAWLRGCWEATSPLRTVEEQWVAPHGGSMLAVSRTVRGERLAAYELIVLREEGGRLAYEAHPSGQTMAVFLSTTVSNTLALFENPHHDFPQRVGYQRAGTDSLLAWIEGAVGGDTRRIEFRYARVACGSP